MINSFFNRISSLYSLYPLRLHVIEISFCIIFWWLTSQIVFCMQETDMIVTVSKEISVKGANMEFDSNLFMKNLESIINKLSPGQGDQGSTSMSAGFAAQGVIGSSTSSDKAISLLKSILRETGGGGEEDPNEFNRLVRLIAAHYIDNERLPAAEHILFMAYLKTTVPQLQQMSLDVFLGFWFADEDLFIKLINNNMSIRAIPQEIGEGMIQNIKNASTGVTVPLTAPTDTPFLDKPTGLASLITPQYTNRVKIWALGETLLYNNPEIASVASFLYSGAKSNPGVFLQSWFNPPTNIVQLSESAFTSTVGGYFISNEFGEVFLEKLKSFPKILGL